MKSTVETTHCDVGLRDRRSNALQQSPDYSLGAGMINGAVCKTVLCEFDSHPSVQIYAPVR